MQVVQQTIATLSSNAGRQSYAALDLDLALFCDESQASAEDKVAGIDELVNIFCSEEEVDADAEESKNGAQKQSKRYIAGILLLDLLRFRVTAESNSNNNMGGGLYMYQSHNAQVCLFQQIYPVENMEALTDKIISASFADYAPRNLQARITAALLTVQLALITENQDNNEAKNALFSKLSEVLQEEEALPCDYALRSIKYFLELADDHNRSKETNFMIAELLPVLFQVFTSDDIQQSGREQILQIFLYLIRSVAWADGIDNELVEECLGESFQAWMALLLQIVQANPRQYFNVKRQALKCLIVIFRDLVNYSRDSLNSILKPAWKLLNAHLPVFTEVVGYNQPIPQAEGEEEVSEEEATDLGYESDDEDEIYGVEGMTFYLIELLSTLVQRPNVQPIVAQGLLPLMKTVTSYLILQHSKERAHFGDTVFFISDKSQDMMQVNTIRSQCLVLISSLIEAFSENAISTLILVIQSLFKKQSPQNNGKISKQAASTEGMSELEEFQALLQELQYVSGNPKDYWKRRETGLLLIQIFIEDMSMFMIKNVEKYDLITMFCPEILDDSFKADKKRFPSLVSALVGRQLGACVAICESIPKWKPEGKKFFSDVMDKAIEALQQESQISIKLACIRNIVKYSRKFTKDELIEQSQKFEVIFDPLLELLNSSSMECLYLPIEAFTALSKINEQTVAQMTPKITPRLLQIFQNFHSESSLGSELIRLFKLWCNYEQCRHIFIDTFIPYIMEIVQQYYTNTPNEDNKNATLSLSANALDMLNNPNTPTTSNNVISVVDAGILQHVLDLLCSLLKHTKKDEEFEKIVAVLPDLLTYIEKSEDMFLLLHGTTALKTFIHQAAPHVLKVVNPDRIIAVCKKLLSPQTNEQAALCLGNLVIQVINKIQPKIDTSLLMCVVWKIYKSRMPSIVQSLVLIFARLIQTNPNEIVEFLSETSIENRICLKIVLDKWLLQQALFRGTYTRTVTLSSLIKLFKARDPRIETLMVVSYNPSHSNVNSEVNAPFKMLSILLRFLEYENKPTHLRGAQAPLDDYSDDEEQKQRPLGSLAGGGFSMQRTMDNQEIGMEPGSRMDTMGGDDDSYDNNPVERFGDLDDDDKLDVGMDLDDIKSDDEDSDPINLSQEADEPSKEESANQPAASELSKQEKPMLEEVKANEPVAQQQSPVSSGNSAGKSTNESGSSSENLFAVGQAQDKGLADMETGSEVYMSELLAGFDMDDFEDADEANEEDLVELEDAFAQVDIMDYIEDTLNEFVAKADKGCEYVFYCAKQLPKEDKEQAKRFIKFPAGTPELPM